MYVMAIGSIPLAGKKEVLKRAKRVIEKARSGGRPDFQREIGLWGFDDEDKGFRFVQVFEAEDGDIGRVLRLMAPIFTEQYGDIPGLAYSTRFAFGPEELFEMHGI